MKKTHEQFGGIMKVLAGILVISTLMVFGNGAYAVVADRTISSAGYYTGTVSANQNRPNAEVVVRIEVPTGYKANVTAMQTAKRWGNADNWTSRFDFAGEVVENPVSNKTKITGTLYSVGYVTIESIVRPEAKPWPLTGVYESYYCDVDYSISVSYELLMPDLLVSSVSLSPSPAAVDEGVTLSFTVRNGGFKSSQAASIAKAYLDGTQIGGNLSIGVLQPGGTSTKEIALPELSAGNHTIKVVTDATGVIEESNELNNERTEALLVYHRIPYSVRFDANGGSGTMSEQSFISGTSQPLADNAFSPPSLNHVFAGWATSNDGNVVYEDGEEVRNLSFTGGTVTLYAVWMEPFVIKGGVLEKVNPGELRNLVVPYGVTRIGRSAFLWCDRLESVTLPSSVVAIEDSAFWNCTNMTRITLPASLADIGNSAFYGCAIRWIDVPEGVANIAPGTFRCCRSMIGITLPSSVTNINGNAFSVCDSLAGIMLPEGVRSIGSSTFDACPSLVYAYIPSSVERIGPGAFARACNMLQTVIFAGNAPTMETDSAGSHAFRYRDSFNRDTVTGCTVYVPRGSTGWGVSIPGKWVDGVPIRYYDHVVTFDFNGGESPSQLQLVNYGSTAYFKDIGGGRTNELRAVEHGAEVGQFPTVIFGDHVLKGWYTAREGGSKVSDKTAVMANVTYYAQWMKTVPSPEPDPEPDPELEPDPEPTPDPTPEPDPTQTNAVEEVVYAGVLDTDFAKAQTVNGALYKGDALVGTVQVKIGKVSKKGAVKVSATATLMMDGKAKKVTAKAGNVTLDELKLVPPVKVSFKAPIGDMTLAMESGGTFTLKNDSYLMAESSIGGALKGGSSGTFRIEGFDLAVPGELQRDLLPITESFSVSNGKWAFTKAAGVKWAKPKKGAELPDIYDEESGKGLIIDDTKGKTNCSGLKLTYTTNTGQFKGSFKVYALQGTGKKTKLVKYTVNVIGFVVDGVGYGEASCKKPAAGPWHVTVE